jgi:7,8-dihydroneopterin aldolase/epimerase/oxygenase
VWQEWRDHQRVILERVDVAVRLGAYAHERAAPQLVSIDVELFREHGAYGGGGLMACLDYDRIYLFLREVLPTRSHTDLLEELAEDVVAVCLEDRRVEACRVTLRKPEIYGGRAVPALQVFRRRAEA